VRWGWASGAVAVVIGAFILAVFLALFNYLTPSRKVTVAGRVVEVIPNVTGQIIAIPVKTNVPVKTGDVCFRSIRRTFNTRSRRERRRWPESANRLRY
jgi:multidrug resistance efflux pump